MGMKLFDEDDDLQNEDLSKIEVNTEYARRFEYNKKREDLQRYEELKKKGVIGESSGSEEDSESESSSDEEDLKSVVGSKRKDLEFFDALIKVRNQDPSLKQKEVKLFESDDDQSSEQEEEKDAEKKEKKDRKAMYLKDVLAKQLMEEGPEFQEQEKKIKTYNEEQEELRKAVLDAAEDVDDDNEEDFLRIKGKQNVGGKEDADFDDGEFTKKLEEYFGGDGELDENKMFLKEYFKKKMWQDKERKGGEDMMDDEMDELLRDEEEVEKQEDYELEYNFRHEENAGDRVMGFSRKVEGSVRKKENTRKEQRKRKEERMMIAEMERKEELKHLKNLKKEEIKERMMKVMKIAGIKEEDEFLLGSKDLDKEFDPEEYDKMMKAVFDEKYYDAEDEEFGSDRDDIEKPNFDEEDELLGLPRNWDVLESGDGFLAARERSLRHKSESGDDDETSGEDDEKEDSGEDDEKEDTEEKEDEKGENGEERKEEAEEGKRKRKRKMSLVQRAKQEMLEEFYKLDYEDTIGDLKTRFKYARIKPNKYGLKTEDVLMMDESELNQYVSLKKLAPYRDAEWEVPKSKKNHLKRRRLELIRELRSNNEKAGKKGKRAEAEKSISRNDDMADKKAVFEESNGHAANQSKRAKTRHRQRLNLSHGRRLAYGKITSKPKKKKEKH